MITKVIKECPTRLRQYQLRDLKGYYKHSALLNANTSQLPPITNVLNDKRPLPKRGQLEVDKLLENSNLAVVKQSIKSVSVETKMSCWSASHFGQSISTSVVTKYSLLISLTWNY